MKVQYSQAYILQPCLKQGKERKGILGNWPAFKKDVLEKNEWVMF